jgi:hypothetical protein
MALQVTVSKRYIVFSTITLSLAVVALIAEMLPEVSAKLIVIPALLCIIGLVSYTFVVSKKRNSSHTLE